MTPSTFKALFPEFSDDMNSTVQAFIDLSAPYFDPERWGDFLSEGMACFVAHRMAVAAPVSKRHHAQWSNIAPNDSSKSRRC